MTKVMNMMATEKGPIAMKSHLNNIVFYQLYTLCFGEKWVYTIALRRKRCFLALYTRTRMCMSSVKFIQLLTIS